MPTIILKGGQKIVFNVICAFVEANNKEQTVDS